VLVLLGVLFITLSFLPLDDLFKVDTNGEVALTENVVVDTETLVEWTPNYNNSNSSGNNNLAIRGNALELSYDVGDWGYVVVTKGVNATLLKDSVGISFRYKGSGAVNSIEFKLILKYEGDTGDTTFGKLIRRATDTGDEWIQEDVLYTDMECWWPEENCELHGDQLDTAAVLRLDFVVSNKEGDDPGEGVVYFTDVVTIVTRD
jgi:hypothetical protein